MAEHKVNMNKSKRAIQGALNDGGFYETKDYDNNVDGVLGKDTEKAVRKFQAAYGLKQDGIIGPKTMAALEVQEVLNAYADYKRVNIIGNPHQIDNAKQLLENELKDLKTIPIPDVIPISDKMAFGLQTIKPSLPEELHQQINILLTKQGGTVPEGAPMTDIETQPTPSLLQQPANSPKKGDITANEVGTGMLLTMLPYDADKVQDLDVNLAIGTINNGSFEAIITGTLKPSTLKNFFYVGETIVSFQQKTDSDRRYFRLIADSDVEVNASNYSKGFDAAAWLEVDKYGHPLLKDGKKNVIETYPGMNNDELADALDEKFSLTSYTSYNPKAYQQWAQMRDTAYTTNSIQHDEITAFSHSMGKPGMRAPEGIRTVVIDGWDEKDDLMVTALHHVLETETHSNETEFKNSVIDTMHEIAVNTIEINPGNPVFSLISSSRIGGFVYEMDGAGHTGKGYINKSEVKLHASNGATRGDIERLAQQSLNNGDLTRIEALFIKSIKNAMENDGNSTLEEENQLNEITDQLSNSGVQYEEMQEAYQGIINQKCPNQPQKTR